MNHSNMLTNLKNNEVTLHTDTINKRKMRFKITNIHPKENQKNKREIEKQLFEIFKNYE